jgi:DNA-binding NarL/FixJ family response regulator
VVKTLASGKHSEPAKPTLTPRQQDVVQLLAAGLAAKEIAARLGISARTVEYHKYKTMQDLGLRTSADLIRYAVREGLDSDPLPDPSSHNREASP